MMPTPCFPQQLSAGVWEGPDDHLSISCVNVCAGVLREKWDLNSAPGCEMTELQGSVPGSFRLPQQAAALTAPRELMGGSCSPSSASSFGDLSNQTGIYAHRKWPPRLHELLTARAMNFIEGKTLKKLNPQLSGVWSGRHAWSAIPPSPNSDRSSHSSTAGQALVPPYGWKTRGPERGVMAVVLQHPHQWSAQMAHFQTCNAI